jgi:hypothetical protein
LDLVDALAGGGADEGDGATELGGEGGGIDGAAAFGEVVGHVEDDEGGEAEAEDGGCEEEVSMQISSIEDEDDGVGLADAGFGAGEDVAGDLFVLGAGLHAVNAGEIDEEDFAAGGGAGFPDVVFDGDAGEVGYLLTEAGEAVKERGFAGVGRADEGDVVAQGADGGVQAGG